MRAPKLLPCGTAQSRGRCGYPALRACSHTPLSYALSEDVNLLLLLQHRLPPLPQHRLPPLASHGSLYYILRFKELGNANTDGQHAHSFARQLRKDSIEPAGDPLSRLALLSTSLSFRSLVFYFSLVNLGVFFSLVIFGFSLINAVFPW